MIEVIRLSLFKVEGLHDAMRRSYKANITNEVLTQFDTATRGGRDISQSAISRVAVSALAPSAEAQAAVGIVNGWQQSRYRFILQTREGDSFGALNTAYYIGYTDYADGGYIQNNLGDVQLDPNMQFYVTSVHRIKSVAVNTDNSQQNANRIVSNVGVQYLFNDANNQNLDIRQGNSGLLRMRPEEVFRSHESLATLDRYGVLPSNTFDFTGATALSGETSTRRNNAAGTFLYDLFTAYNSAVQQCRETGTDLSCIPTEAAGALPQSTTIFSDALITELQQIQTAIATNGQFSFMQLCRLAPHVDSVTSIVNNTQTVQQWNYTNTQDWRGSDMGTVIAASLAQSVPTIMLENMMADIRLDITNMTATNQFEFRYTSLTPLSAFAQNEVLANRVAQRIINELLLPLSQQNVIPLHVTIDASIYGETFINLSFNGMPPAPYVMPTFADNGTSPILTNNQQHYDETVHSIYSLANHVLGVNNIHLNTNDQQFMPSAATASFGNYGLSQGGILVEQNTGLATNPVDPNTNLYY